MVPPKGIEPYFSRLSAECSTIELQRHVTTKMAGHGDGLIESQDNRATLAVVAFGSTRGFRSHYSSLIKTVPPHSVCVLLD